MYTDRSALQARLICTGRMHLEAAKSMALVSQCDRDDIGATQDASLEWLHAPSMMAFTLYIIGRVTLLCIRPTR